MDVLLVGDASGLLAGRRCVIVQRDVAVNGKRVKMSHQSNLISELSCLKICGKKIGDREDASLLQK